MRVKAKEKYTNAAGIVIPSITTVLDILNKPALKNWANKMGLRGIDITKYTDELADIGTLTHYFITSWLKEEIPDVSDFTPEQAEAANICFKQYTDWESRNRIKPILIEERLVSEKYQYGGTPDVYGLCGKDLLLVDFKTSASGIFPEMGYQVAAQEQLVVEAGYRVTKGMVLRLGRGGYEGAEEKIYTRSELDTGFQIFLRCLDIYNLRRKESTWIPR